MGCALYDALGMDCWSGPRCGDCPTGEWAGPDDPVDASDEEADPKDDV